MFKESVGLYHDDSLAIIRGGPCECKRMAKKLHKLFEKEQLGIKTEIGNTGTDFLNLYLDLKNDCYRQWKKPNNQPIYVHKDSNHPPTCIKQIPLMIENMITRNCSSKEEFDKVKDEYQVSLKNSGYNHILNYNPKVNKKKRSRKRVVTWFNPPWNDNVKTNLAERFLKLVDEQNRKVKGTLLEYIFTRSTIKVSYGTTRNMKAHISCHNKKILKSQNITDGGCNCKSDTDPCPLQGECLTSSVVYKATVTTNQPKLKRKTYHGMTEATFKKRWYGHKDDIKNKEKYGTTLSRYI